jgi:hypothetical protein
MERDGEGEMAKPPGLNELDMPEWAELAVDNADNGGSYCSAGASRQNVHRRCCLVLLTVLSYCMLCQHMRILCPSASPSGL